MSNKHKSKIAKSNFIKSLSIAGGITTILTAVGLGVSIPVYNKIKENLRNIASDVADLSKFMNDLTNKLGIPAGQTFEKELAGGYILIYSDGKTKIYSGKGDDKSLIMNMNEDGSVGSAAQLEGPAAQKMLGVISEAKNTIGDEATSMKDILEDYSNQAEDSSIATESIISGEDKETIIVRNILSTKRPLTPNEKYILLTNIAKKSGLNISALKTAEAKAQKLVTERKKTELEEKQARSKGKQALIDYKNKKNLALKQKAITYLTDPKLNHKILNITYKNITFKDITSIGNEQYLIEYYNEMKIKDASNQINVAKRNIAKKWLDKNKISYKNVVFKDTNKYGINAKNITFQDLSNGKHDESFQNFYIFHVTKLSAEKSEEHQINSVSNNKNSSVLKRIASSITSWPSIYSKAKYGYLRSDGSFVKKSNHLLQGLKSTLLKSGISNNSYLKMTNLFDKILDIKNRKPTKFFNLTTVLNTYNSLVVSESRLLVLKVEIEDIALHNSSIKYLVARSSTKSINNLESFILTNSTAEDLTIDVLIRSIKYNFSTYINEQISLMLIKFVEDQKISSLIKNNNTFEEIIKIWKRIDNFQNEPAKKEYIEKWMFIIQKRYLLNMEDIEFKENEIFNVIDELIKQDNFNTKNTTWQNSKLIYSLNKYPWMKQFLDFTENSSSNDFVYLDNFSNNLKEYNKLSLNLKKLIRSDQKYLNTIFSIIIDKPNLQNKRNTIQNIYTNIKTFAEIVDLSNSSNFDPSNKENIKKIKAAADVSISLQNNNMKKKEADKISDLFKNIVVSDVLDSKQFQEIIDYTNTIFSFTQTKIFNILEKVFRPGYNKTIPYDIKEIVKNKNSFKNIVDNKIAKLNKWVSEIKLDPNHNSNKVTQEELEKHIWLLDKHSEIVEYKNDPDNNKIIKPRSTISANFTNKNTYVVDHSTLNNPIRHIFKVNHDPINKKTTYEIVAKFLGTKFGGLYISSQFVGKNGNIFWFPFSAKGLQPSDVQYIYEWDPNNPQNIIKHQLDNQLKLNNLPVNIRSAFVVGNNFYLQIENSIAGKLIKIEYKPNGISKVSSLDPIPQNIFSGYKASYNSWGFSANNNDYFITPVLDSNKKWKIVLSNLKNTSKYLEWHSAKIDKYINSNRISSVIMGDFDSSTKEQTFFIVSTKGGFIKFVVNLSDPNNPVAVGNPLPIVDSIVGDTRGATLINGAISIYTFDKAKQINKVLYIASQTKKLNDIFKTLLSEK